MNVCMVTEGGYPVIRGGLSEWCHQLIRESTDTQFSVFCMVAPGYEEPVYELPKNVSRGLIKVIGGSSRPRPSRLPEAAAQRIIDLVEVIGYGDPLNCEELIKIIKKYPKVEDFLTPRSFWTSAKRFYQSNLPNENFSDFLWWWLFSTQAMLRCISLTRTVPQADLYHAASPGYAGLIASLAKHWWGSPVVVTEQGFLLAEMRLELESLDIPQCLKDLHLRFAETMVKTSYKYADRLNAPSNYHVENQKRIATYSNKSLVIKNGIEVDRFIPKKRIKRKNKPLVGTTARVVPVKGITMFIKAAAEVNKVYEMDFVVVGEVQDEDYYKECIALVEELGLGGCFKFMGHQDSRKWYGMLDIFILSSISEGVPYSLLEAMSCGLPSVCTAVGGVPDTLPHGEVGYVIKPGDYHEMAQRIISLVEDPVLMEQMGKKARIHAERNHSITQMVGGFNQLYRELVSWEQ
ncbi:MAG: GT4 family glycosyltransferase PelF [Chloroflexota bacterium]|nr:GT4 family glycosyltransferase PelF [Chloroflexota bacterium]